MAETLTPSQFSALKGRRIVAQGQRVSVPPWVEVRSALTHLPRPAVFRSGETRSQGGGEGKAEWGLAPTRGTGTKTLCVQPIDLWVKTSIGAREAAIELDFNFLTTPNALGRQPDLA
jgi:hypothetical protein